MRAVHHAGNAASVEHHAARRRCEYSSSLTSSIYPEAFSSACSHYVNAIWIFPELSHHVGVVRVAARSKYYAFSCVILDIPAVLFRDYAGNCAVVCLKYAYAFTAKH